MTNHATNPFRASQLRPGIIPYQFPAGATLNRLLREFSSHQQRGQIVGPHGSGKSTLLGDLQLALTHRGSDVVRVTLHQNERCLPISANDIDAWTPSTIVLVDGCEQLSRWQRWRLWKACRQSKAGLIVTSHRCLGLPTLWQTTVSVEITRAVVDAILRLPTDHRQSVTSAAAKSNTRQISDQQLGQLLVEHDMNVRELLFALYDWHNHYQLSSACS